MINIDYKRAILFTKNDNLLEWLYSNVSHSTINDSQREYYARTREVQLILLVRYEKGKIFAKIKCPINPLPVRGEFEIPSVKAITKFLVNNGWIPSNDMRLNMFS